MTIRTIEALNLITARKIIHAPEAFTKKLVRQAVAFINICAEATEEDRFWAYAAADI